MDRILERTVHKEFTGASLGDEFFSDLDYADDVALLAEMLEVFMTQLDHHIWYCSISVSTKIRL